MTTAQRSKPTKPAYSVLVSTRFLTARQAAKRAHISRVQAYRRIAALRASGRVVVEKLVRERKTGPLARAFKLEE